MYTQRSNLRSGKTNREQSGSALRPKAASMKANRKDPLSKCLRATKSEQTERVADAELKLLRNIKTLPPPSRYLSPLRYPGGKSWLTQRFEKWIGTKRVTLVEPFVGGGSISLHALSANLVDNVVMCELDPGVAAFWKAMLGPNVEFLVERILKFKPSLEELKLVFQKNARTTDDLAWQILLRNRFTFGGIMTSRSTFMKRGERNKGFASRWYPETLANRIRHIHTLRHRIDFRHADGLDTLSHMCSNAGEAVCFADPPYPEAGSRLYSLGDFNHERLFAILAIWRGRFMLTHEDCPYIRNLAAKYSFHTSKIIMHTRSHQHKQELVISKS